jgi:hypothetical protein
MGAAARQCQAWWAWSFPISSWCRRGAAGDSHGFGRSGHSPAPGRSRSSNSVTRRARSGRRHHRGNASAPGGFWARALSRLKEGGVFHEGEASSRCEPEPTTSTDEENANGTVYRAGCAPVKLHRGGDGSDGEAVGLAGGGDECCNTRRCDAGHSGDAAALPGGGNAIGMVGRGAIAACARVRCELGHCDAELLGLGPNSDRRMGESRSAADAGSEPQLQSHPERRQIIGGAIDVHRYLGPGMLEHTYEVCLEAALRQRGLQVERQVPVRVRCLDVGLLFNVNVDVLAAGGWKQVLRRR